MTARFDAHLADREYGTWVFRTVLGGSPDHPGDGCAGHAGKVDSYVKGFRSNDMALKVALSDYCVDNLSNGAHAHLLSRDFHKPSAGAWDGGSGFIGRTDFYGMRFCMPSPYNVPFGTANDFCVTFQLGYPTVLFNPVSFNFAKDVNTTLTAGIDSVTTTIPVADRTGIVNLDSSIKVDSEWMKVTSGGGTTGAGNVTVQRHAAGTTAASHSSGAAVRNDAITLDMNFGKAVAGNVYDGTLGWQLRRWPVDVIRPDVWFEVAVEVKWRTGYGDGGYIVIYYRLASIDTPGSWTTIFDSRTNNYTSPNYLSTGSYNAAGTPTFQWGTEINAIDTVDIHGTQGSGGVRGVIEDIGIYRGGNTKSTGSSIQADTTSLCDKFAVYSTFAEAEAYLNTNGSRAPESLFPTTPPYAGTLGTTSHTNPEIAVKVTALPDATNHIELSLCRVAGPDFYAFWLHNNGNATLNYRANMYTVNNNVYTAIGMTNPFNDTAGNTIVVNDWIGASFRGGILRFWWKRGAAGAWTVISSAVVASDSTYTGTTGTTNIVKTGAVAAWDASSVIGGNAQGSTV